MTTAKYPRNLPQVAREKPVLDSRGLILTPDNSLAWTRGKHSLIPVTGGYVPEDAPKAKTGPCPRCGEPAPLLVYGSPRGLEYYFCRLADDAACMERARKEQAAVTELIAEPPAGIEPEPAVKAPAKPRARPSQPRKAPAAPAAKAAPEDATEPPGGAA